MCRAALLIFAVFVALAAPTVAEAKRVALVIGNNLYDNLKPYQQLVKAGNDARAVAASLKEDGFEVILAEDVRRLDFLRAWQRFLDTVKPGDVTALFYSGHGFEINGSNYLLVRDVPQAIDGEEVLKNSAFPLQALMERLKDQKPSVSIFIVDACRDSPYAGQGGKRGIGSPRGLKPEEPPKGTLIMMSAGAGQEALDSLSPDDPSPNSVYTRLLLPLLKEPGLEITDLAKRLRGNVEALAATVRHEQRPAFYHELSGDFYLVPRAAAAPIVAVNAPATTNEASMAWGATKDTTSVAVLEAFIGQFGDTVYASMARARLDELRKMQVATAPPSVQRPASPAASADAKNASATNEAGRAWLAIKDMANVAVIETFVRQYGDTPSGAAARARLEELKRTQVAVASPPVLPKPTGPVAATSPEPGAPRPPATPAAVAKPETRRPPSVYEAAQSWARVRETKDPAALESFLGQFGDTIYGPMARARLGELASTQVAVVVPPAQTAKASSAAMPAAVVPPVPLVASPPPPPAPPVATPGVGVPATTRPAVPLSAAEEGALKPRDSFTECAHCPEMVVVPAGSFTMGSPATEAGRGANEGPESRVTFGRPFAVARTAVTFEEWDACVAAGGCNGYRPGDEGRPRGRYPVVNVSWEDAQAYLTWLSKATGKPYRLLSEAEREYVTRAGATTPFWWGGSISTRQANYDGTVAYGGENKGEFRQRALPVDAFAENAFGLHQVHGNVNEWVTDCWRDTYQDASADGTAWTAGACSRRALRGGSWYDGPEHLRAAARIGFYPGYRSNKIGFRVARPL